jgi:hypothetical protein
MAIEETVTEVLDEAIQALTVLDLNKLKRLEERVASLAASSDACRGDEHDSVEEALAGNDPAELQIQSECTQPPTR